MTACRRGRRRRQTTDDRRSRGRTASSSIAHGARVPALLISPRIPPGIVQPPAGVPFDHTSVIKTVRDRFAPGAAPLTKRDAVAPSLAGALFTLGPDNLEISVRHSFGDAGVCPAAGAWSPRACRADDRLSAT